MKWYEYLFEYHTHARVHVCVCMCESYTKSHSKLTRKNFSYNLNNTRDFDSCWHYGHKTRN